MLHEGLLKKIILYFFLYTKSIWFLPINEALDKRNKWGGQHGMKEVRVGDEQGTIKNINK